MPASTPIKTITMISSMRVNARLLTPLTVQTVRWLVKYLLGPGEGAVTIHAPAFGGVAAELGAFTVRAGG